MGRHWPKLCYYAKSLSAMCTAMKGGVGFSWGTEVEYMLFSKGSMRQNVKFIKQLNLKKKKEKQHTWFLDLSMTIEMMKESGYMKISEEVFLDKTLWNWRGNEPPDRMVTFERISCKRDPERVEDLHITHKNEPLKKKTSFNHLLGLESHLFST